MTDTASMPPPDYAAAERPATDDTAPKRWPFVVLGVLALLAGIAALVSPLVATLSVTAVVSVGLIVFGVLTVVMAFWEDTGRSKLAAFVFGLIAVAAGVMIFLDPLAGTVSITILIASYFVASGAIRVWWAFTHRDRRGWGWLAASGALSLGLGAYILVTLGVSAFIVPGVLLGLDLLTSGVALLVLGGRSEAPRAV